MPPQLFAAFWDVFVASGMSPEEVSTHLQALQNGPELAPNGKARIGKVGSPYRDATSAVTAILYPGQNYLDLSPWKQSGASVCIIAEYEGKLAFGIRRSREREGMYCMAGGYCNQTKRETQRQAAVREFFEETGLLIDQSRLVLFETFMQYDENTLEEEEKNIASTGFLLTLTKEEYQRLTAPDRPETDGEMGQFSMFDQGGFEALVEGGKAAFVDQIHYATLYFLSRTMQVDVAVARSFMPA